jgi:hypothetical protein
MAVLQMQGQTHKVAHRYLSRPPERLVLEGYRHWTKSVITQSPVPMDEAGDLYRTILGAQFARPAFVAMADFLHTLGMCAKCPLHMFATNTPNICTDETMILGLISGIQNGDEASVELCLSALSCPTRCDEVVMAAGSFALILKGAAKILMPIPPEVLTSILNHRAKTAAHRFSDVTPPTFH